MMKFLTLFSTFFALMAISFSLNAQTVTVSGGGGANGYSGFNQECDSPDFFTGGSVNCFGSTPITLTISAPVTCLRIPTFRFEAGSFTLPNPTKTITYDVAGTTNEWVDVLPMNCSGTDLGFAASGNVLTVTNGAANPPCPTFPSSACNSVEGSITICSDVPFTSITLSNVNSNVDGGGVTAPCVAADWSSFSASAIFPSPVNPPAPSCNAGSAAPIFTTN